VRVGVMVNEFCGVVYVGLMTLQVELQVIMK
jgi:hypothetical protein